MPPFPERPRPRPRRAPAWTLLLTLMLPGRLPAAPPTLHLELPRPTLPGPAPEAAAPRIEITARIRMPPAPDRPPAPLAVVFVLDVSGSMQGQKMVQTKRAAHAVVDALGPRDRVAIVSFAFLAEELQDAEHSQDLAWARATIDGLSANGGTNMVDGLRQGMRTLQELRAVDAVKRIFLLGDGDANVGEGDMERVAAWARDHDAAVSTFGVGEGFDAETMRRIALASGGNFHGIRDETDLREVFTGELEAMRGTAGVRAQLAVKPTWGLNLVEARGRAAHLEAGPQIVSLPHLVAGEELRVPLVLEVAPRAPTAGTPGRIDAHLTYRDEDLDDGHQVAAHVPFTWGPPARTPRQPAPTTPDSEDQP